MRNQRLRSAVSEYAAKTRAGGALRARGTVNDPWMTGGATPVEEVAPADG